MYDFSHEYYNNNSNHQPNIWNRESFVILTANNEQTLTDVAHTHTQRKKKRFQPLQNITIHFFFFQKKKTLNRIFFPIVCVWLVGGNLLSFHLDCGIVCLRGCFMLNEWMNEWRNDWLEQWLNECYFW